MPKPRDIPARKGTKQDSKRLKVLRIQLGLSQRELAMEFYVSSGTVSLWEAGERPIPGPVLKLLEIYEAKNKL